MKKIASKLGLIALALVMLASVAACSKPVDTDPLWADALYTEDTSFGEGSKTVFVEVVVGDKTVTFSVKSDEPILGDALVAHGLIDGDEGPYGLYVKRVNGILADYDVNASYWGFYKDGQYMMTGVDVTEFADGERYQLVYEK